MSNKAPAGKGISKEHSSDQLIDDIGQYCSKCHISVINPCADTRDKISEYDKYSECNTKMSEKEHDVLLRANKFSIHDNSLWLLNSDRLDFTLSKFRSLCSTVSQRYPTPMLAEYFQAEKLPPRFAMMRHDSDRKPGNALDTARKEHDI